MRRKGFRGSNLPVTGNMIGFVGWTVAMSFTQILRTAEPDSVAHLLGRYLWSDRELNAFAVFGSCADGYAPPEQHNSLQPSKRLMRDGRGLYMVALLLSPAKKKPFWFMTCMFLSLRIQLISSVLANRANCNGLDVVGMYLDEKELCRYFSDSLQALCQRHPYNKAQPSTPVELDLDGKGTRVSSVSHLWEVK